MNELFKTTSDVFSDMEIETAEEIVRKTIRTQKNHAKWHTLYAIGQVTGISYALLRLAVARLRSKNLVERRKRGRSYVWRYKATTSSNLE
jgi:predicted transcriptional regulator